MRTIPLDKEHEVGVILETIEVLRQGGAVVIPTDTVYGLAVDARNEKAVERLLKIKQRDEAKGIPVFVYDYKMLNEVAVEDERICDMLNKFGSVTAVLPARGWMPLALRGGRDKLTIGVRIPEHPFVLRIIKGFGGPITGTSANISGGQAHAKIQEVLDDFEGRDPAPDLVVDAGDLPERGPSAVVDFTKYIPRIVRTGPLPKDALLGLLGEKDKIY